MSDVSAAGHRVSLRVCNEPTQEVVERAQARMAGGETAIILCIARPATHYEQRLGKLHNAWFVDLVTGPEAGDSTQVVYIGSTASPEKAVMMLERLCKRVPRPHIIVDAVDAWAMFLGLQALQETIHYLSLRLHALGTSADLLVQAGAGQAGLIDTLGSYVDETIDA